jgi:hypothetical protein
VFEEASAVLRSPGWSSDPANSPRTPPQLAQMPTSLMLFRDPPDHTRLRRLVAPVFAARAVESLRPRVAAIVESALDDLDAFGDEIDLLADYGYLIPMAVIAELLDVGVEGAEVFLEQTPRLARLLEVEPTADDLAEAVTAALEVTMFLTPILSRRRGGDHGDDFISALLATDELSVDEVLATCVLLLAAGHETTANLIGTGTLMLLRHPDQLAAIRDDPALLPGAVEELARYAGPISLGVNRYTRAGMLLAGQRIPAGEPVVFALAAAGRDPSCYGRPEVLDVKRAQGVQLAFGHGIHFCLGAPLARLEATVALGTLLRRLPGLALPVPASQLTWRLASTRGLAALPVTFTPAHNHGGVPRRG